VPVRVRTIICHCIHDWNDIVAVIASAASCRKKIGFVNNDLSLERLMTAAIQGAACALSRVPYHNRQIRGVGVLHLDT